MIELNRHKNTYLLDQIFIKTDEQGRRLSEINEEPNQDAVFNLRKNQ